MDESPHYKRFRVVQNDAKGQTWLQCDFRAGQQVHSKRETYSYIWTRKLEVEIAKITSTVIKDYIPWLLPVQNLF
jgi:hypothetical protein